MRAMRECAQRAGAPAIKRLAAGGALLAGKRSSSVNVDCPLFGAAISSGLIARLRALASPLAAWTRVRLAAINTQALANNMKFNPNTTRTPLFGHHHHLLLHFRFRS